MWLIRLGELAVKSGERRVEIEKSLLKAAREAAEKCGGAKLASRSGRLYTWGDLEYLEDSL